MVVEVTSNDEDERVIYEVLGKNLKVITDPRGADEGEVIVEIWDDAGCSAREARPADQAQRIALRTLFNEIKADEAELADHQQAVVA